MPSLPQEFQSQGVTLSPLELAALNAAVTNLSQTDPTQRGIIPPRDYPTSAFALLEAQSKSGFNGAAYALDAGAFQIIRYTDTSAPNPQWLRFGIQRQPDGTFTPFVSHVMFLFKPEEPTVNLARDAADVARHLNAIRPQGLRVLALLGAARLDINAGMELIEYVQTLVANLDHVAYMTGGYRGESGNCYGVTRAGFDVPKAKGLETLVIMCRAGAADSHQSASAMSLYGKQWGDDTPALTTAADAGVFFRNIPKGKIFGRWTNVEIANFVHRGKSFLIIDPTSTGSQEVHFGTTVPVFRDAISAANYLAGHLPSVEAVKAIPPYDVAPTTMVPIEQHEKYMAVRLYLDGGHERARWVSNDDAGHRPLLAAGLRFSTSPEALQGERDLVLDGYWKDILLLQILGKLPEDGMVEDLARAYNKIRTLTEKNQQSPYWPRIDQNRIAGIWFLWSGEHFPDLMQFLNTLPDAPK